MVVSHQYQQTCFFFILYPQNIWPLKRLSTVYVSDEPTFYPRVLSLCRALSQYLLSVSQLPSSLHIPSDKEHLITTFTCTATEVKHRIINVITLQSSLNDSLLMDTITDWFKMEIVPS